MANLFNDLKPKANPVKNGFDLSERHTYTARAGMLYPVMTKEVIPGDYFEIDCAALSRTQTLVAPSFARVKQYHHFFFVPYNSLWHNWDEFYTQRFDPINAGQKLPLYAPTLSIYPLYSRIENDGFESLSHFLEDDGDTYRYITDMLGYGDPDQTLKQNSNLFGPYGRVNVFRLLAYKKIWQDYYRNHYRDDGFDAKVFNMDDIPCDTLASSYIEAYRTNAELEELVRPCYRGWKKDIFMGSMPTMQFGDVSVLSTSFKLSLSETSRLAPGTADNLVKVYGSGSTNAGKLLGVNNVTGQGISDTFKSDLFDVLALRRAEKMQEWKQKTLLAGNRTSSQYIAHLGEQPWRENDHANYIGGFESVVQINEVTQTTGYDSSGAVNKLGDLAGKGIGATQGSKIKFRAKDFGVIMCIVSFVPELEYDGNYLDKANTLFEQFDWFTPEFENLGLEPVVRSQFTQKVLTGSTQPADILAEMNQVLGYVPRYSMYKTSVDRCHLNLASYGSMSYYSTPRVDMEQTLNMVPAYFYIRPNVLDSIFGINIDGTIETDQFICVSSFDVKAIRPISKIGIPSF